MISSLLEVPDLGLRRVLEKYGHDEISLKYWKNENGTDIIYGPENMKSIKNSDFLEVFAQDFILMVRNQKKVMRNFLVEIFGENYLEATVFKDSINTDQLKTEILSLKIENQDQILSILPFFNAIGKLEISGYSKINEEKLQIDKIMELDQWKQAKELEVFHFRISAPIQNFLHFSRVFITLERITVEDLVMLKKSPTLEFWEIWLIENQPESYFSSRFGPPNIDSDDLEYEKVRWFFKIPFFFSKKKMRCLQWSFMTISYCFIAQKLINCVVEP
ncbi:hypothetical protein CAEBREN_14046 [Caenorhabditis brenneri]|uniref:DUF38 domain-containing protein n=1 Tax=Caenorhabditis brenneri TaxID=135651 RepID=G0N1G0_CAEBE|nr:hypothetical protein CAEBREN_14046 [Caenorhabditis brenneri]